MAVATRPLELQELRAMARQRADMVNSTFCTDDEISDYINESIKDLYEFLISVHGENFVNDDADITTAAGTSKYDLPTEAWRVIRVGLTLNNTNIPLRPYSYVDKLIDTANRSWSSGVGVEYHLNMGAYDGTSSGGIAFQPIPDGVYTVTVWFHPKPPELTSATDTLTIGFDEWVILDVAIKMLMKEESDASTLIAQKERLEQRIMANASERDVGRPAPIIDVRSMDDEDLAYRTWWF